MKKKYVICDTNIFIHLFLNNQKTISDLLKIGTPNIIMTSITKMELLRGTGDKNELTEMKKKILNFSVLNFNEKSSLIATELIEKYHLSHSIQIPDAIIAAASLAFDLPLFTYNIKDFAFIPEIKLFK